MKKYLLITLGIILLFTGGCARLEIVEQERYNYENLQLKNILNSYGERTFRKGVFDCSNKAALLYDALTRKGYRCKIILGQTIANLFTPECHVWLIVKKGEHEFHIEPPVGAVVPASFFWKYIFRSSFNSLAELKKFHSENGGDPEEYEY